jgi:glycosyltransferase involved in cell wall biosynthesis
VRFIGWTENVEDLLRESKILILTSENEGTPMSIIQAQLMGLPVIATDVGSVNEVLENGKSGFVLPYNPTKFAEAIINFKTDRHLYISFSDAAKNFAEGKFTTTRLVIDHEELYLRLISKHQANFVPKAQA